MLVSRFGVGAKEMRRDFESTYLRHRWRFANSPHCKLVDSTHCWWCHMGLSGTLGRMEGSLQYKVLSAGEEARCRQASLLLLFRPYVVQDFPLGSVAVRIYRYLETCWDFALGSVAVRGCSYLDWCWSVKRNLERESARYLAGLKREGRIRRVKIPEADWLSLLKGMRRRESKYASWMVEDKRRETFLRGINLSGTPWWDLPDIYVQGRPELTSRRRMLTPCSCRLIKIAVPYGGLTQNTSLPKGSFALRHNSLAK